MNVSQFGKVVQSDGARDVSKMMRRETESVLRVEKVGGFFVTLTTGVQDRNRKIFRTESARNAIESDGVG